MAKADQVIDRAMPLSPRHPAVVYARLLLFIWTARYAPALAMLDDADSRRSILSPSSATRWHEAIRALDGRQPRDVEAVRRHQMQTAIASPGDAVIAIQILSLLGEMDAAFAVANGYLLRRGTAIGQLRPADGAVVVNDQLRRKTVMLFTPNTAEMRADPRFMPLVKGIGLADYWRRRGAWPDFLRR